MPPHSMILRPVAIVLREFCRAGDNPEDYEAQEEEQNALQRGGLARLQYQIVE